MQDPFVNLLQLAFIFALILINAFFVSAEFAIVNIRRTRIEELIATGNKTAPIIKHIVQDPARFIAATQLGVTMASLGIGWLAEPAIAHLIEPIFGFLPNEVAGIAVHLFIVGAIAFALVTYLDVVIGELAPKSLALAYSERIALLVARPMLLFELKMLVSASAASGALEPSEKTMLHNVFEFNDRQVREVMIPRPDMIAIEENTTIADFMQTFAETGHARFPIYAKNIDNVTGFMAIKDVLREFATRGSSINTRPVRALARPATFVPDSKRVGQLFAEMQARRTQLAIVIDEFGGTAGMVTMEEIIEEIVGQLADEQGKSEPLTERIDERSAQVDGQLRVEEVNEQMGLHLPESEEYETIAGYILYSLHHIPQEGEQVRTDNVRLKVTRMEGPRIEKVLVTRL
jgi:CBS domain containing-hemolysin-like protein